MRPRARAVLLACAAALTAAASAAAPALAAGHPALARPAAQSLTWTVTPSPDTKFAANELLGISCTSATSCTAVGFTGSRLPGNKTLIESWNGTAWSVVPSPDRSAFSLLYGVSCISASACTAVGDSYGQHSEPRTLVEAWDGRTWAIVPSPSPGVVSSQDYLTGVSCTSPTACMAVGSFTRKFGPPITLAESWNGTSWAVLPTPNPGPGPGRTREGDWLQSVSCTSATACTAVGYLARTQGLDKSIIESWNGTSWTAIPHPAVASAGNYLTGVSCAAPARCTAVGTLRPGTSAPDRTLAESWDGTTWSLVPSPNVTGASSSLQSVSCPSASMCAAAGSSQSTSTSPARTLVESWDGSAWAIDPSPNPGGSGTGAGLDGVSCPGTATCLAAGSFSNGQPGVAKTLIELGTSPAS